MYNLSYYEKSYQTQVLYFNFRERLHPWAFHAPSLVHYHVVKGRYNYTKFHRNQEIPTLYYGTKNVRLNKYAFGVRLKRLPRKENTDYILSYYPEFIIMQDRTEMVDDSIYVESFITYQLNYEQIKKSYFPLF